MRGFVVDQDRGRVTAGDGAGNVSRAAVNRLTVH